MSDSDPINRLNAALDGRYRIERQLVGAESTRLNVVLNWLEELKARMGG